MKKKFIRAIIVLDFAFVAFGTYGDAPVVVAGFTNLNLCNIARDAVNNAQNQGNTYPPSACFQRS